MPQQVTRQTWLGQWVKDMKAKMLRNGFRETTISAIRKAVPFAKPNHRSMLDTVPQLNDVTEAVRLYQRPADYFNSSYYMGLHDRADYKGADPMLRLFTWRFMRALRARGLPFYVHTCYRSPEQQAKLVGKTSRLASGAHQRSAAVDIVSAIDHWDIPEDVWYYVGTLGEAVARDSFLGKGLDGKPLKIEWGGRWKGLWDPAHWQLSDWERRMMTDRDAEPVRLFPYSDQMRFG